MIGGLGAVQLKPSIGGAPLDGTGAATGLFQGGTAPMSGGDVSTSFADMLTQAASKTVGSLHNAEQVSLEALKGNADTRQVADAVMGAQQALQTAVAIRDKIVSAYLDVSRMSI